MGSKNVSSIFIFLKVSIMSKIHIAFLWHQHQPLYKNPSTGIYDMPWVRLHATKDYYDLAAILDDFPEIKFNINLVPSLMMQLDDYATSGARDKFMDLTLIPADSLSQEDLSFILYNFFMANWETMIDPYPRYRELLEKRGRYISTDELKRVNTYFKKQDILDLQMWFNLTWVDPYWRKKDPFISQLFEKGKNFTEEEKKLLIEKHIQICGAIIPKHKELQDRNQLEISTTPFYHPILPLLCDTNSAKIATPLIQLPKNRFSHPEDARHQIKKALEFYEMKFKRKPEGFWPSEGSVSEEVASIFSDFGINWLATDEEVLFRTDPALNHVSKQNLYEPYRLELTQGGINIVFRDHALSDSIGFVYSKWNHRDAVDDFMEKIYDIKSSLPQGGNHLISVILDGENCWEYYPSDGRYFLSELFKRISESRDITSTTISDYLKKHPPKRKLKKLHAGSWIGANFGIWIGHPEDNLSWDYLCEARKFISEYEKNNPDKKDSTELKKAKELLYIAEGSDWNWWYGDDHSSSQDMMFDALYRSNLRKIYETLGEKAPDGLYIAIKGKYKKPPVLEPISFITPKIDGVVSNYYEWLHAGYYHTGHSGGSMHQVESVIRAIYYGFDLENIYLRFDTDILKLPEKISDITFKVIFLTPEGVDVVFSLEKDLKIKDFSIKDSKKDKSEQLNRLSAGKIIEFAIPFGILGTKHGEKIEFVVVLERHNCEVERWPFQNTISLIHPSGDYFAGVWSV